MALIRSVYSIKQKSHLLTRLSLREEYSSGYIIVPWLSLIYLSFTAVDLIVSPGTTLLSSLIVRLTVVAISRILFLLSRGRCRSEFRYILTLGPFYLGVEYFIIQHDLISSPYFSGLLLVMICGAMLFPLKLIQALWTNAVCLLPLMYWLVVYNDFTSTQVLAGLTMLIGSIGVGAFNSGVTYKDLVSRLSIQEALARNLGKRKKEIADKAEELTAVKVQFEKSRLASLNNAKLAQLASQVAHDIRSPVAALNVVSENMSTFPEDLRKLTRSAIDQITAIANDLLKTYRKNNAGTSAGTQPLQTVHVYTLIEEILSEKRIEYQGMQELKIESGYSSGPYRLFVQTIPSELRRVISNLINNSVEALSGCGHVQVLSKPIKDQIEIQIVDNGPGIPEDILTQLIMKGGSYNKEQGHGLGLAHARQFLSDWNCHFEISSDLGQGTVVRIRLPLADPPDWFATEVVLVSGLKIIVADDDPSIHSLWERKLKPLITQKVLELSLVHIYRAEDLRNLTPNESMLLLCDQEFAGDSLTGLQAIVENHLRKQSILVTHMFSDPEIQRICLQNGIKIIPKSSANLCPIRT